MALAKSSTLPQTPSPSLESPCALKSRPHASADGRYFLASAFVSHLLIPSVVFLDVSKLRNSHKLHPGIGILSHCVECAVNLIIDRAWSLFISSVKTGRGPRPSWLCKTDSDAASECCTRELCHC